MQRSDIPARVLEEAARAIVRMEQANSVGELEEGWKDFLTRIDRFWNKAEAHFGKSPKWHGWAGRYIAERNRDPLLLYLRQARNVEEHQIDPITDFRPIQISINPAPGRTDLQIDRMEWRKEPDGISIRYEGSPAMLNFFPGRTRLLPVTNRGRTYDPPAVHAGKSIAGKSVIDIANIALDYYRGFLAAAAEHFYA